MKRIGKTTIFVVLALVLALGALGVLGILRATAVTPGLYLVEGNPNCSNLYQATVISGPDSDLLDLGPLFGFKYDANPTGDVSSTLTDNAPWVVTNGPQDPNNSVSISNVLLSGTEGVQFDWSATLGIDAVIVKAQDANAYVYSPEAFGDSGLVAPGTKAISHIEFCYDYELTASKTADATWYKTIDWTLTKDVTPASADRFIGQSAQYDYTVTLTKNETFGPYIVDGTITVNNPTPYTVDFDVADSADGTPAVVECPSYTLAPGASVVCTYSADLASNTDGTNTATITSLNANVKGATATHNYAFGDPLLTEGSEPETVTANDTLKGDLGSFSGSQVVNYSLTQDCSAEPGDYADDGIWSNTYPNTASINETTGDSDSETVTLTCYAPIVDKDATATWYRDVDWSITKDVTPPSASKFIGQSAQYDYTVTLTKWESDEYDVSGTIYVSNPAGSPGDMTVSLVDMLDATTAATVDCGGGATSVTVATGATESCSYTGDLAAKVDGTNTATGTFLTYDFVATYPYAFGAATYLPGAEPETVTANDTLKGDLGSFSGSQVVNYSLTQDCSAEPGDYADDGIWSDTYPNTASINETTGDSDSETVTLTCYAPIVDKDATATWYRDVDWSITKDVTPASADKFIGESATYDYVVTLTKWESDEFDVSGTIYVSNPAGSPGDMTVDLVDMLDATTAATVDCGEGATSVTVASGATESCSYTGDLAAKTDGTNTATGTFLTYDFVATYPYAFGAATYLPGAEPETVTANDTLKGALGSFSASGTAEYSLTQDCSDDPADYEGDGYWYMDYPNTASINETTGDSDSETVRLNCYAPVVDKDADGSYDEYHDWTVDKSVDPTQQSAFAGDTVGFDWTVTVEEEIWEENFGVSGQIHVYNPAPMAMTVLLSDVLDDGTVATITGCSDTGVTWDGTNLYIPAGVMAICDYTATPSGGPGLNNFAAALPDGVQFKVAYPVSGGDAYFPTVTVAGGTVLDGTYDGWCVDTDHTIANNTWYNANVYSSYEDLTGKVEKPWNMDLVNWIVNQGFVYQPSPGCSGSYTYGDVQRAIWALIEDNQSTSGLGSWSQCRVNEILAAATANGEGFVPDCNDYIAVVLEPVGGAQVIAITQVTMIEVDLECPAENTATVTLNDIDFSASAEIEWTVNVVHGGVTLDDDQNPAWPMDLTDGGEWTYTDPDGYTCSSNPEDYVNGGGTTYQAKIENTATLHDGDEFLDDGYAYTLVDCYIPTISKTAAGTYDERHEWTVDKTVTPLEQGGYPGDVLPWTWTVYVYEDVYEENFDVAGTITVGNPNPDDDLVVALSDELSDLTAANITGCTGGTYSAGTLTVPAGGTADCNYEANDLPYSDDTNAPGTNYATITLNGIDFTADDAIEYTAKAIRPNATLTDDLKPLNESLTGHAQAGSYTFGPFEYDGSHTCSSNRGDYFVEGVYTQMTDTIVNWAYVYSDDELQDEDDATTTWTCDASFVDIYKTTNGQPADPEDDIQFVLYSYDNGTAVEEEIVSTLGVGADLKFQTALVPGDGYTICEYPVPAAYTFEISVNGDNVLTYPGPPGEENPTGEIQCFDFTAEPAGTTVTFNVNNRYPGGAPRTPGYWKNWNRCSGGNQADTADRLNDYLGPVMGAGVYLLDDLLPQTLGDWEITTCEVGVLILDTRNLDGDNMNNDAAYTLATALLAARLNQDAGACDPDENEWAWEYKGEWLTFEQVLGAADDLLAGVGFDGTGRYLGPGGNKAHKALRADALYLYGIIDDYNNSLVCTGDPSH